MQVKVGSGNEDDLRETAAEITAAVDAVVVHQIGFTLTLYRSKALPRRPRIVALAAPGAGRNGGGDQAGSSEEDSGSDGTGARATRACAAPAIPAASATAQ